MSIFSIIRFRAIRLGLLALIPASAWSRGTYTTNFPLTENPVAESGKWINGGVVGLDWANVRTTSGFAFGTQSGTSQGAAMYADSTAVLAGTWGPNQTAQATISVTNAANVSGVFEEVELRLRTTITAHSITGYEVNGSVSANSANFYIQIVRWNGPLGSFTLLNGTARHCVNGDVLKATISGSTITAYLNGVQVLQATDNTYSTGSPGMGFFLQGASGLDAHYGLSNFTTTDGSTEAPSPTPRTTPAVQAAPRAFRVVHKKSGHANPMILKSSNASNELLSLPAVVKMCLPQSCNASNKEQPITNFCVKVG